MNRIRLLAQSMIALLLFGGIPPADAGNLNISNEPLSSGTRISVKPNLMFILDDSGSMASDYMPDYVNDARCVGSQGGNLQSCGLGDPPYSSSGYNTIYYNPKIHYRPPKRGDAAGNDWGNASTTIPRKNPFDGSTATQNLSAYPDAAWCRNDNDRPTGSASDSNCVYYQGGVAFNYPVYPNSTYRYRRPYNAAQPYYYTMSGSPLWCTNSSLTSCVARRDKTHTYPRFTPAAGTPAVTGVAAYRTFYVIQSGTSTSATYTINNITYDGTTNILTGPVTVNVKNDLSGRNALADAIVAKVGNGFTATIEKYDTSGGNNCSDSRDTLCPRIRITAPGGPISTSNSSYNNKTLYLDEPTNIDFKPARDNLGGGVDHVPAGPNFPGVTFTRRDIKPGATFTKYSKRDDCAGASCTDAEELQNFANWYSYYRTRILMTKSAMSLAFSTVSDTSPGTGMRVGLMTISAGAPSARISDFERACWTANKALEMPIGDFNQTQKLNFYTNLFGIQTCSWTPLRGALSRAGRLYAGRLAGVDPVHSVDPVQYSCQPNFTLLSTDGYWNNNIEDNSFGPRKEDNANDVGNQDGAPTLRPQLDGLGRSNTLADVAMYYYKTDLRPNMADEVPVSPRDPNNKQHMATFTMGLGVDGTLIYSPDYEAGGSPDYNAILQSSKDWPDPINNTEDERIDDLWHAAVNGRGKYFSAADPDMVVASINEALNAVATRTGASAAAATSNLEPVAGDNYAYVASYTTGTWEGNLDAKTINLSTGALSEENVWSAQPLLDTKAVSMAGRTIYKFDPGISGADKKELMTWANLTTAEKAYFEPVQLGQCNQIANCPGATAENLFNYLMGKADATQNGSYRIRRHVLGDIVSSQPVYVKAPPFAYADSGYAAFKTDKTSRQATVYVAANDGFLHALDASSGQEAWAFSPTAVLPNLYQLANSNYQHRYYVDGSVVAGDVKSPNSTWKTILVGSLNAGGKSYYALDITDPANPKAMWEFADPRMGYSYGNPVITKLQDGTWVVLVTSGYNNGTALGSHDGQGVLYVLDATTGTEISRVYTCTNQADAATCSGSSASPNGLAKINNWVDDSMVDNVTRYVYGGDLNGDVWRFDINASPPVAVKVASLGEPITTRPELAEIATKRVMFFGTGLFLQPTDKADIARRSVYAIKDCTSEPCTTLTNVKAGGSGFIRQTLVSADANSRTMSSVRTVNWNSDNGWYVEFLDAGERVNVDPKLQLGTLVVATNVPENAGQLSCTSGGSSWLYYFDITTGGFIVNSQSNPNNIAGYRIGNSLAVGTNVVRLPNGKLVTIVTTSDNKHPVSEAPVGSQGMPARRVTWRELVTD